MTDSEAIKIVGRNVKTCRLRVDLTQDALAELVDCHWKTIGKIETGTMNPTILLLGKIATHLGVRIDHLLAGIQFPVSKAHKTRILKAKARQRKPSSKILRELNIAQES